MKDKKGCVYVPIYLEWLDVTQDLSAEEKGHLIDAVVMYASDSDEWIDQLETSGEKIAFRFMRGQVDRNKEISKARSLARSNKQEQNGTNENKEEQTGTKVPKEKEKDKEKEKKKDKEVCKKFTPPTVDEVALYCVERKNHVNAEKFVDYYTANGWKVGGKGLPMKDWRAAIRTWERSEYTEKDYQYEKEYSGLPY